MCSSPNAGIAYFRPTTEVDANFFDEHFNTNVRGLYFTVQKALPLFREGSSVVLNASAVTTKGLPGSSVYSATKAAVRSFAEPGRRKFRPRKYDLTFFHQAQRRHRFSGKRECPKPKSRHSLSMPDRVFPRAASGQSRRSPMFALFWPRPTRASSLERTLWLMAAFCQNISTA